MKIETTGIHKNISNDDYHASQGISNSGMGLLLPPNCPKLYWYRKLSGQYVKPKKKYFDLGSLVHTLALEPKTFNDRYIMEPTFPPVREARLLKDLEAELGKEAGRELFEMDKANKAADIALVKKLKAEFEQAATGKQVIDQALYDQAKGMADSLRSHAKWKELKIDDGGCIEDSLMWEDEDTGVLLRSRPDFYNDFVIVDVKTTSDCTPFSFARSIADYAYHRQGALSSDGLTKLTGTQYDMVVLFVVAEAPPHLRRCYIMTDAAIELGRQEYKQAAEIYKGCITTGVWEGYPEVIEDIDLPKWKYWSAENE